MAISIEELIEERFPGLQGASYRITSPHDNRYNCIAWAAGDAQQWWWPDRMGDGYWPEDAPRTETLESFTVAFQTLGYERCDADHLEEGYEKVAIFAAGTRPLHAAKQLESGFWSSKLGRSVDIEHPLRSLEGAEYGLVAQIMRRQTK